MGPGALSCRPRVSRPTWPCGASWAVAVPPLPSCLGQTTASLPGSRGTGCTSNKTATPATALVLGPSRLLAGWEGYFLRESVRPPGHPCRARPRTCPGACHLALLQDEPPVGWPFAVAALTTVLPSHSRPLGKSARRRTCSPCSQAVPALDPGSHRAERRAPGAAFGQREESGPVADQSVADYCGLGVSSPAAQCPVSEGHTTLPSGTQGSAPYHAGWQLGATHCPLV